MHTLRIDLTEAELKIIGSALGAMPYAQVKALVDNIDRQVSRFIDELSSDEGDGTNRSKL